MIRNRPPRSYHDYQLSKARRSFGDKVLDLKWPFCHGQISSFSMVIILSLWISRAFSLAPMTSKANKLPLKTEPVACDNDTSWTCGLWRLISLESYSCWKAWHLFLFFFWRKFDNFQCIDRMISICTNLLQSKSTNVRTARGCLIWEKNRTRGSFNKTPTNYIS